MAQVDCCGVVITAMIGLLDSLRLLSSANLISRARFLCGQHQKRVRTLNTWPKGIYGDVIGDQPVKLRHLSNAYTFVCSSMATEVKHLIGVSGFNQLDHVETMARMYPILVCYCNLQFADKCNGRYNYDKGRCSFKKKNDPRAPWLN